MKLIFKLFSYVPANSKVSLPEFNAPNEISAKDHMSLPPEDKPSNEPTRLPFTNKSREIGPAAANRTLALSLPGTCNSDKKVNRCSAPAIA